MAGNRILLKISGEMLCEKGGFGIDPAHVQDFAQQIKDGLAQGNAELAMVCGGGNFLRGAQIAGDEIGRITGDNMGMLATIMNALALQSALERAGVETRVLSAIPVNDLAEPFIRRRALRHLEKKRVVVLAGGTGNPYFTTDTTAALRALQIRANVLAKGTKVDGVYSADPEEDPDAEFFEELTFLDVLQQRLRIMDSTAVSLCMDNSLPINVFNMKEQGNIVKFLSGERLGTMVV
ncbi:MAG: UMP kinase [Planctomycetota bacterium]|nr:UMP kinase [Planctomycetota bacterium]|tara:strand:+ start:171 stop:878 length:708 start_codon:yes stop_codon:yes gene_type:complete